MTFNGSVTIKGRKTGRPSQRLVFHQKDLKIISAQLTRHDKKGDEIIDLDRINTHKRFDELRFHSKKLLYPGANTLTIEFSGKITEPMNGLYPSNFVEEGKKQMILATQFESHHAREVFPCIDEPEAKATFDLTLITPDDGGAVISNTPVKKQETVNDRLKTSFETTPVMSTYLLAFAHGNMTYLEAKTARGTLVRTYATPSKTVHTGFALETAVKYLQFYEDYFNIPYPLEKCDLIALPDFASGAMENWGMITFREQCLIYDPVNTSLPTKQYVAMVTAHELAHMWFGNLVTMRWWTDLWLNEGFASWVEYLAVDKLFPEWDIWTQFITDEQQPALKLDALDNTHPVEVPIKHPDEIRSIFDAISYNKGASVIHMLHGYLGAEDFRDGLRHYLTTHAYKNTDTADLWASLEEISGKPVKKFMHTWTSQPGFPLVSVENKKGTISLSQQRFYTEPPKEPSRTRWPVPLLAKGLPLTLDSAHALLAQDDKVVIKLNEGQTGFYRTRYDADSLAALKNGIPTMEPLDRLGLLADTFETAKAGLTSVTDALKLLDAYQNETNAAVWDIIAMSIGEIRRVMDDERVRKKMKPFIIKITSKELVRLGWEEKPGDSHFDRLLRPTIIGLNASADEPSVLAESKRRYNAMKIPEDIPADLRGVVYSTVARHGDAATFIRLLGMHDSSSNSEERTTLAAALTAFKQPELIEQALEQVTTEVVRNQDAMYWVAYSFMNYYAKHYTWEWMVKNWNWLEKNLGSDLSFYRTPIYAARSFSDETFAKEYKKFFKEKSAPGIERSIKQGAEMLAWQIAWKKRDLSSVLAYLGA